MRDIEVLISQKAVEIPEVYKLDRFVINTGNTITATASVRLIKQNGEPVMIEEVSTGDGPVDAAFRAIEKIVGVNYVLEDYKSTFSYWRTGCPGRGLLKLRKRQDFHR